ncbi:MAG: hypothetical protein A2004_04030 [Spirochaetes bacterium GWC1_61_12]|nr:MAG: hypothetical protein A2004_04030 [Spirochaetes bacterium GWC1_61_12]OHD59653.1 MAG: hypothetical protein A2Y32_12285 [Spirochaetes bacterium GWF1_60_12]
MWLILFLAVLVLFVFKWETIRHTLESTRFLEALTSDQADQRPLTPPAVAPAGQQGGDGSAGSTSPPAGNDGPETTAPETTPPTVETTVSTAAGSNQPPTNNQPNLTPALNTTAVNPVQQLQQTSLARLFFVRVDDDGTISRREVQRTIASSDSPLTDAVQALLRGPNSDELNQNLITLIPNGTRLLSAQVRGSTAYLNFSEEFMYNRYGIEGYAGQLKQIVFTATEFPTVKDVFILIEGQTRDYLGGEGVYIGRPLSRSSF